MKKLCTFLLLAALATVLAACNNTPKIAVVDGAKVFRESKPGQDAMAAEQQRVVGLLQDQFNKILEKYRKDNKVDVIIAKDVALSYDEANDITNKVIEEINKTPIDLNAKPAVAAKPDAAAAPAAAAPAAAPKAEEPKKP